MASSGCWGRLDAIRGIALTSSYTMHSSIEGIGQDREDDEDDDEDDDEEDVPDISWYGSSPRE